MNVVQNLAVLAVRELVDGVGDAIDLRVGGKVVDRACEFLAERFTDHSQRLTIAIQGANDKAWRSLEIALAGDSFWDRCKSLVGRAEDKAFAQQVRAFLDAHPLPELSGKTAFRQNCLQELRAARKLGALTAGDLDPRRLAREAGSFVQFSDPQSILDAEWRIIQGMAEELKQASYSNLGWLVSQRPAQGMPLLILGVRYYFRRAVEEDQRLFQGLSFAKLEMLGETQQQGFADLSVALTQHSQRLEELLGDVYAVAVETRDAAVETRGGVQRIEEQLAAFQQQITSLTNRLGLRDQQVRPTDTTSIRTEDERQLVRTILAQYRAMPESERLQRPALLSAVARLENAAGNHEQAVEDFRAVATLAVDDKRVQAEAHYNAYQAALERASVSKKKEDWDAALRELVQSANLHRKYLPFDARKYQPKRILGAGGFGVTFLCKRRGPDDLVAVKSLIQENLGRDMNKVLDEGRLLGQLDHPAIVRMIDCDYVDHDTKAGPFVVMEFFDGATLEDYVQPHKHLPVSEAASLFRLAAEGLKAAHAKGVWHRDIKPANLLVRRDADGWRIKIIDFGLALRKELTQAGKEASTSRHSKTLMGGSIAGTVHYAAPEQMDPDRQKEIGPWSDVYGFGKTCYYALFGTPTPDDDDKDRLPETLKRLLSRCTAQTISKRPQSFAEVVEQLAKFEASMAQPAMALIEDDEPPPTVALVEDEIVAIPEATPLAPWYVLQGDQQRGPLNESELRGLMASGKVKKNDLVWRQGMPDWVAADSVIRPGPPPLPGPPATRTPPAVALAAPPTGNLARVQFIVPPANTVTHMAGKAVRGYLKLATYGLVGGKVFGSDLLKFYLGARLLGEGSLVDGFNLDVNLEPERYKISVAHWVGNAESDRKELDLDLRKPGEYQIRFNYIRGVMGGMSGSTIEILKDPGFSTGTFWKT